MSNIKPLGQILENFRDEILPTLRSVTLSKFLAMNLPPRENILDPWCPKAGLVMIHAKRGIGKTFFALEVTMAIAYGHSFLSFIAPKAAQVLYIDGEMPANTMQARLAEIKKRMPEDKNFLEPVFITPDLQDGVMPDLSSSEGRESLRPYAEQADVIIVDNISTLCGSGKENDAESWLPIQQWALSMRRLGKSVIFIHHAGKNGHQRGTSKREDILDTVITLKHPSDYDPSMGACFELHFEKARGIIGDDVSPILCNFTGDGWKFSSVKESNYNRVIELAQDGLQQKDIAEEVGLSKAQVSKLIKKAKQAGKLNM